MAATVDVENPIELRKAGMRALTTALGYEGAQAFLNQSLGGTGDWTRERHELPELGFERLTAELKQFDVEKFLGQFGKAGADIIAAKNARGAV
jgi:hypothetical protein